MNSSVDCEINSFKMSLIIDHQVKKDLFVNKWCIIRLLGKQMVMWFINHSSDATWVAIPEYERKGCLLCPQFSFKIVTSLDHRNTLKLDMSSLSSSCILVYQLAVICLFLTIFFTSSSDQEKIKEKIGQYWDRYAILFISTQKKCAKRINCLKYWQMV